MTTAAQLAELCSAKGTVSFGRASQEQLDQLGLLLDELERVEAFLDSNPSTTDRKDGEAEMWSLIDRIDGYMERV